MKDLTCREFWGCKTFASAFAFVPNASIPNKSCTRKLFISTWYTILYFVHKKHISYLYSKCVI